MAEGSNNEYKFGYAEKFESDDEQEDNMKNTRKVMHESRGKHPNFRKENKGKFTGGNKQARGRKNVKGNRDNSKGNRDYSKGSGDRSKGSGDRSKGSGNRSKGNRDNSKSRNVNLPLGKDSKLFMQQYNQKEIDRTQLIELEIMDPENIIIFLSKNNPAFEKLITDTSDFNKIVLFLRVISKLCISSFNEYKRKIIMKIMNKDFLQNLQINIFSLAVQDDRDKRSSVFFWEHQKRFWINLLTLYNTVFDIMPREACEKLPKIIKATSCTVQNLNKDVSEMDDMNNIIKALELLSEKVAYLRENKSPIKRIDILNLDENFRHINVYASIKELTTREYPSVQRIIKEGAYESVEQYLDIQFRLLREDYVRSLRDGICSYLENQKSNAKRKQLAVRFYENVKFIRPHVVHDRVGILVSYSTQKKDMIGENKPFKYGSLVSFTRDNFQTIVYGTVVEDPEKLLNCGNVGVDVQDTIIYNEAYILVETTIHFETRYQVLKALQNMKEENFPMKKYIINVSSDIDHPKYLNKSKNICLYPKNTEKKNGEKVTFEMLSKEQWPPAEYFKLNESQYKAFHAALTSEFSIIHGPPGTGKTYTCLKIVEFLLKNKQALQYSGPILVICLTNHALDQFLEGILQFSKEVVRVGSQSKNPKMDDYNLKQHRRKIETNGRHTYYKDLLEAEKEKVDQCVQKLQCLQNLLEDITCKQGILNFNNFKSIDDRLEKSWFDQVAPDKIVEWLLEGMDTLNITEQNQEINDEEICFQARHPDEETKIIDNTENYNSNKHFTKNLVLTLTEMKQRIEYLRGLIVVLKNKGKFDTGLINECNEELQILMETENYLTWRINQKGINTKLLGKINYNNPHDLSPNERWNLYRYWVHLLHLRAYQDIAVIDEVYRAAKRRYEEVQHIVDVYIMQEKYVIGMTTSGAAKLQPVLQTLKCEIVIVEEAAEILESEIIASLTNHCQQLILIGDHRQLRPSTIQHSLAKQCNLEISLFERMINNGVQCHQLEVQHRMRPEFAELITPAIYSNLKNDESVLYYPQVRGLTKNLYFIIHNEFEEHLRYTTSHKNIYEAKYLLKLASYLVKQGYKTEEITLLTTYKGQMNFLSDESNNYPELENIRITVVDNFQGEENKIILLSLVRSNENENIGFLRIENRVCVALSRAKEGFFMIGNMNNLEKSNKIWPKIIEVLMKQNSIGPVLTLKCRIHNSETTITTYTDFDNKVPDGGCNLMCGKEISCGHKCVLKCHFDDKEHLRYQCKQVCTKLCGNGHVCQKLCSDICGKCVFPVEKRLPCEHSRIIPCSADPTDYKCQTKVEIKLPCKHIENIVCGMKPEDAVCSNPCLTMRQCGHICKRMCHLGNDTNHEKYRCNESCRKVKIGCSTQRHICCKQCSEPCEPCTQVILKKRTTCSHEIAVPCSADPTDYKCQTKVEIKLPCKHTQNIECWMKPEDAVCSNPCQTMLKCGHICKRTCHLGNDTNHEKYRCRESCRKVKIGCSTQRHICCKQCSEPCEPCTQAILKKRTTCSHEIAVPCNMNVNNFACRAKCDRILPCNHRCTKKCYMVCGNECPIKINKIIEACGHTVNIRCDRQPEKRYCENRCTEILDCRHPCEGKCNEECYCARNHCCTIL